MYRGRLLFPAKSLYSVCGMAKSLNKSRMYVSRIAMVLVVLLVLFTRQTFKDGSPVHETLDLIGILLVALCAMGRIYSTAFLGGHKNQKLIDYGPFSVVRNPLYMFSLLGITGIALMSNQIFVIFGLPLAFLLLYEGLISREEKFLKETFGEEYEAYCKRVPQLIPRFSVYQAPDTIVASPKLLWQAFRDATVWFIPIEVFELIEFAQQTGWLPHLF